MRCNIPEGVEVKLSADLIRPLVVGKHIIDAAPSPNGRYAGLASNVAGLEEFLKVVNFFFPKVIDVRTKGKFMYWSFENDWYMYCTFGMSGQFSPTKGKHPSFVISVGENTIDTKEVFFNDPRHFGTIKFVKGENNLKKKLAELGWDPLNNDPASYISTVRKVSNSNKPIGQLLMDQKLFAGVGNYIRAEALYQAKISPWRPGSAISKEEVVKLFDALVEVMDVSYQHQGATISTYSTPYGEEGKYSSCFKVYGQKQDPMGNQIVKEETPEGRAIHWCPAIQS